MLHTSFIAIDAPVLRGRGFKGFYHIWMWRSSWSWTQISWTNICTPAPWKLHMKLSFSQPSVFRGDDWRVLLTTVDWATYDGRMTDDLLYHKLTYEPIGHFLIGDNLLLLLRNRILEPPSTPFLEKGLMVDQKSLDIGLKEIVPVRLLLLSVYNISLFSVTLPVFFRWTLLGYYY